MLNLNLISLFTLFNELRAIFQIFADLDPAGTSARALIRLNSSQRVLANNLTIKGSAIYKEELQKAVEVDTGRLRRSIFVAGTFTGNSLILQPQFEFYGKPLNADTRWILIAKQRAIPRLYSLSKREFSNFINTLTR